MPIDIEFIAYFRLITGEARTSLDFEEITIMDAITELGRKYGSKFINELIDRGDLMEDILFLKNGKLTKDPKEKLKTGDVLSFIPPAFGG